MNWSGVSDRSVLGRALRLPLRLIPEKLVVPIMQGRLKGQRWIVGASVHGCWLGSYEFEKRRAFEETVRPGSVVFDLGAQAGFYTLLASTLVGPTGRVLAFEPLPRNLFYLKEHVRLNNISNVTIIDAAVSDRVGVAYFDQGCSRLMGHLAEGGELRVETVMLDKLVLEGRVPAPDLMKIDIEGAEAMALEGAKLTLAERHPDIFLSTHGNTVHKTCCRFLGSLGYSLSTIDGGGLEQASEVVALWRRS